jgi:RHS repeat-associated protein
MTSLSTRFRLAGLIAFLVVVNSVRADDVLLDSTFTWPRFFDDSVTYTVKIVSTPRAVSGGYQLSDAGGDVENFNVDNNGKITSNAGSVSPDGYMVTYTFQKDYGLDYNEGGAIYAGDFIPPSPYTDPTGHPPRSYDFQVNGPAVQSGVNFKAGPAPEKLSTEFTWNQFPSVPPPAYFWPDTDPQHVPVNNMVRVTFSLDPRPDQSLPPCNASGCTACLHMAGYSFDMLRAGLRMNDTPVSYSVPKGPAVAFSITYNQRDVGQLSSLPVSNVGRNWTYNWLSYIVGNADVSPAVQRFAGGGGLENYIGLQCTVPYGDSSGSHRPGTFAPERQSRAVLNWDPANHRYLRTLPDGSYEVYAQVVNSDGTPYYLLTKSVDAQQNAITLAYDGLSRLISVTDAIGQVTTLTYDLASDPMAITAVTDPFGRKAKLNYQGGNLVSSIDPLNIVSAYTYDGTNFLNSLSTPYGTTTFSTDSDDEHQAIQATNPLGQTERAELRFNSVSAIADSEANVPSATGLIYLNSGLSSYNTYYWNRKAYTATPDYTKAHIWHWLVGSNGLTNVASSEKKALEGRVWMSYQGQTDAGYIPDEALNSVAVTARVLDDGTTTQHSYASYNSTGLITQSIDPIGRTTNYAYASNGIDLTQVSQANGSGQDVLSAMTYNGQHEPLTTTNASGRVTTMTYNGAGQLASLTDAKSETSTLAYDGNGYLTSVTGPVAGATTSYTYDSVGRVHTVTDSEGYTTTASYDNFDRLVKTTYPDGTSDQTLYDDPSAPLDVAHTIDRQGRVTTNKYDAIRELIQTTDPQGRSTKYGWCTCGGLATLTDANGHVTTWNLDLEGRVGCKVYADSSEIDYSYETTTSRLAGMQDAVGNATTYTYNVDNTLASSAYAYTPASGVAATPNVSFSYDPVYNRVTSMVDGSGSTSYGYNVVPANAAASPVTGAGRLASVSTPIAGSAATVAYSYDELGRVTGRSVDGATTNANNVGTTFDSLGRVTGVSNALGSFGSTYVDTTSRLAEVTYPNGQKSDYSYFGNTGDQRLQEIKNYVWGMFSNTPLSKFDYTYNPVGTIATWAQQADNNSAATYALGYDGADQLTSAVQTAASTTVSSNAYAYDPAGNRLAETTLSGTTAGQFNALNQLLSYGASGTQTVAGNTSAAVTSVTVNAVPATVSNQTNFTASVPLPSGTNVVSVVAQPVTGSTTTQRYQIVASGTANTALTYDANGNTLTDENGNHYQWDALNRLAKITYPSTAYTTFAYDGLSRRIQIAEYDATGSHALTSTKNYLWIGSEMAEERDASNTVTKRFFPQGEQQGGTSYYYTRDHLGSVREMTNSSGAIVARYDYDPYGRTTLVSGTNLSDFQYAGMYMHQTSGLNLTYFRAYDPTVGRWLSRDPYIDEDGDDAEIALGPNLYQYVLNSPIDYYDPLGLDGVNDMTNPAPPPGITLTPGHETLPPGSGPTVPNIMPFLENPFVQDVLATVLMPEGPGEAMDIASLRSLFRIGKRVRCNSVKEAKEAAQMASPVKKAVKHMKGEGGPHYHPAGPNGKPLNHDHYYFPE